MSTERSMKRSSLQVVPQPKRPAPVPYSLVRKAARQFKGSYAPRSERHSNIRKLIAALQRLGDDWLLSKRHAVQRKGRA